jgi:phosphoadenosine phosphosulfate reductase
MEKRIENKPYIKNGAIDKHFLAKANKKLSNEDVSTVLNWTKKTFGTEEVAMTTAFGYSGLVLLHHVINIIPDINIYFIDTGYHFQETLDFCDKITDEWNLNLTVLKPDISKEKLKEKLGKEPYKENPDLCCHYNKVEPLLRILKNHSAWLSGIRRDQSITRADIEVIELDGRGKIKISPMSHWTRDQTWEYIHSNDIPYNPLHDQRYMSIGCEPCTVPVEQGGDERDGRWPFMQKLECGIHLNNNSNSIE